MEPLTIITAVTAGVNNAISVIKQIIEAKSKKTFKEKILALQSIILDLQTNTISFHSFYAQLHEENLKLDVENRDLRQRIKDIGTYKLFSPFPGTFVYQSVNPAHSAAEPVPWICPNCFDNHGKKSILQIDKYWAHCSSCNSNFRLKENRGPVSFGR